MIFDDFGEFDMGLNMSEQDISDIGSDNGNPSGLHCRICKMR